MWGVTGLFLAGWLVLGASWNLGWFGLILGTVCYRVTLRGVQRPKPTLVVTVVGNLNEPFQTHVSLDAGSYRTASNEERDWQPVLDSLVKHEALNPVRQPDSAGEAVEGHQDDIVHVEFSPDGRWLATASDDYTARLWPIHLLSGTGPSGALEPPAW